MQGQRDSPCCRSIGTQGPAAKCITDTQAGPLGHESFDDAAAAAPAGKRNPVRTLLGVDYSNENGDFSGHRDSRMSPSPTSYAPSLGRALSWR